MANEPGSIYFPANAEEIRDDFLTDVRLEAIAAGVTNPAVHPLTDWHILGTSLANISLIQYANINTAQARTSVLDATGDDLDEIREAYGLPEVPPSGSSGQVIATVSTGAATFVDGLSVLLPNGLRAKVSGTQVGVVNGGAVDVAAIDVGESTNFAGGTKVRFVTPPVNVASEATVSTQKPLSGGTDIETDDRKRARILNRLQNAPAGGNWAHLRETILNKVGAISDVFIYPALGGPSSVLIIPVKAPDPDNADWSRAPSAAAITDARAAINAAFPSECDRFVKGPIETTMSISVKATLPLAIAAGGDGRGWIDATVWPQLVGGDSGRVYVSGVTSSTQITVTANTATAPVAGVTHVAWWSPQDRQFRTRLVTVVGGAAGAWQLTLDAPLVDSTNTVVTVGDYISPAAVNLDAYGETWTAIAATMGPTEMTADANRLPRSLRHPKIADSNPAEPTARDLALFYENHTEITDVDFGFTQTIGLPLSVAGEPGIFVLEDFGVYKL